jgi:hypothetical protein
MIGMPVFIWAASCSLGCAIAHVRRYVLLRDKGEARSED